MQRSFQESYFPVKLPVSELMDRWYCFFREDSRLHVFFPFFFFLSFLYARGTRRNGDWKGQKGLRTSTCRVICRGGFPIDLPAYNALLFYNCSSLQINRSSPFILIKTTRARVPCEHVSNRFSSERVFHYSLLLL